MDSPGLRESDGRSSDRIEIGTPRLRLTTTRADILRQPVIKGVKTFDLAEATAFRTGEVEPSNTDSGSQPTGNMVPRRFST